VSIQPEMLQTVASQRETLPVSPSVGKSSGGPFRTDDRQTSPGPVEPERVNQAREFSILSLDTLRLWARLAIVVGVYLLVHLTLRRA
jgi:hypothetical protein